MTQAHARTIQSLLFWFISSTLLVAKPITENFPQIDQRKIIGADDRCGTVALGSWLVWLAENGHPSIVTDGKIRARSNPFYAAKIPLKAQKALGELDQLCGGDGEIKLLRLVEGLVDYLHRLPNESLRTVIHYYNLPNDTLLRQLYNQNASIVLLYGIYQQDTSSQQLYRVVGHYTCLLGHTDIHLIANTYATDYKFNLDKIPMERLATKDRYKPSGTESLVYMHYPKDEYPNYTFRSFAAQDPTHALQQTHLGSPLFANSKQVVFLEGALAFWVQSPSEDKH